MVNQNDGMKYIFYALLMTVVAVGCKKREPEETVNPMANYYFVNSTGKDVTIRVADDSDWTAKPMYLEVAAGNSVGIPNNQLMKDGKNRKFTYYWMAKDRSLSDWHYTPWKDFDYDPTQPERRIEITKRDNRKDIQYCLEGIDGSTRWVAVNAYDAANNSVWGTLNTAQRLHEIELQFSKQGVYKHSNLFNVPTNDYFLYDLYSTDSYFQLASTFYQSVDTSQKFEHIRLMNDGRTLFNAKTTSTDTLFFMPGGKFPYYVMVRQH